LAIGDQPDSNFLGQGSFNFAQDDSGSLGSQPYLQSKSILKTLQAESGG
jgi:hypothetical protein